LRVVQWYPQIHIFQCMLERTDVIRNEFLESITFSLAYPTVFYLTFYSYGGCLRCVNLNGVEVFGIFIIA
jgi:hypothetical protein